MAELSQSLHAGTAWRLGGMGMEACGAPEGWCSSAFSPAFSPPVCGEAPWGEVGSWEKLACLGGGPFSLKEGSLGRSTCRTSPSEMSHQDSPSPSSDPCCSSACWDLTLHGCA